MKRWFFIFFMLGIFFFTAIAFIAAQVTFPLIPPSSAVLNQKFYDYSGITHAHSSASTGSGSYEEMIHSANKANCNFLVITDLNPVAKPPDLEAYTDDVLVIRGAEYSYLGGHILAYGFPDSTVFTGLGQTQLFFNDLLHQKPRKLSEGVIIAAHPFLQEHMWENLSDPGLNGMEVLNLDSIWRAEINKGKLGVIWSFFILPFNPDLAYLRLFHDPVREIASWDENLVTRRFTGFAGSDSTANVIPFPDKSFKFPSYTRSFSLMKNHILLKSELTGTYQEDRKKVTEALNRGNFYFSIDLIGDPAGFYFIAKQGRSESLPGEALLMRQNPVIFNVDLGRDLNLAHEIILWRDGQKVAVSNSRMLYFTANQPGAYRTTVRVIPTLPIPDGKTWYTWIFSNAIRIE